MYCRKTQSKGNVYTTLTVFTPGVICLQVMEIVGFGSTMCFLKHLDFIWSFLPVISFPCWDTRSWSHAVIQGLIMPCHSHLLLIRIQRKGLKKLSLWLQSATLGVLPPFRDGSLRGDSDPRTAPRFPKWAFSFLSCCQRLKWGLGLSWGKEWLTRWADRSFCFPEIYNRTIILHHHTVEANLTRSNPWAGGVGWG